MRTQRDGIAIPAVRPAAGRRRRPDRQLAALGEAPHAALPVSGRGRIRVPLHRPADHAPSAARTSPTIRRRWRATTSSSSVPTCSSRRCSRPASTAREVYLPAGDWIDLWRAADYDAASGGFVLGGAQVIAGGADGHGAGAARRAAALRARRRRAAAAAARRRHARRLRRRRAGSRAARRSARPPASSSPSRAARPRARAFRGERYRSIEGDRRWELEINGTRRANVDVAGVAGDAASSRSRRARSSSPTRRCRQTIGRSRPRPGYCALPSPANAAGSSYGVIAAE